MNLPAFAEQSQEISADPIAPGLMSPPPCDPQHPVCSTGCQDQNGHLVVRRARSCDWGAMGSSGIIPDRCRMLREGTCYRTLPVESRETAHALSTVGQSESPVQID